MHKQSITPIRFPVVLNLALDPAPYFQTKQFKYINRLNFDSFGVKMSSKYILKVPHKVLSNCHYKFVERTFWRFSQLVRLTKLEFKDVYSYKLTIDHYKAVMNYAPRVRSLKTLSLSTYGGYFLRKAQSQLSYVRRALSSQIKIIDLLLSVVLPNNVKESEISNFLATLQRLNKLQEIFVSVSIHNINTHTSSFESKLASVLTHFTNLKSLKLNLHSEITDSWQAQEIMRTLSVLKSSTLVLSFSQFTQITFEESGLHLSRFPKLENLTLNFFNHGNELAFCGLNNLYNDISCISNLKGLRFSLDRALLTDMDILNFGNMIAGLTNLTHLYNYSSSLSSAFTEAILGNLKTLTKLNSLYYRGTFSCKIGRAHV